MTEECHHDPRQDTIRAAKYRGVGGTSGCRLSYLGSTYVHIDVVIQPRAPLRVSAVEASFEVSHNRDNF